jgi:hypothetical protein
MKTPLTFVAYYNTGTVNTGGGELVGNKDIPSCCPI